jgi:hypothetical protein
MSMQKAMAKPLPKLVYHYCSVNVFMQIISSKSLWLTNAYKTNDRAEIRWIDNVIKSAMPKCIDKYPSFYMESVQELFKINSTVVPYIFCLSENGDLLSQWRSYADDGAGVSIAFAPEHFGIQNQMPGTGRDTSLTVGIHHVVYDKLEQETRVVEAIESPARFVQGRDGVETCSIQAASQLVAMSSVFKSPAFSEEREWRIIHTPLVMRDMEGHTSLHASVSDLCFRSSRGDIISYFSFGLSGSFGSELIPHIILGPKCKVNNYDLFLFLSQNGLRNTKIARSQVPYQ